MLLLMPCQTQRIVEVENPRTSALTIKPWKRRSFCILERFWNRCRLIQLIFFVRGGHMRIPERFILVTMTMAISWQGERLLQLPIWLSSTRYLSTELTVASSPQWESRRDPEWQPLSVHRKQPLTEGIHGEMDLLGARALQGAVLKRGCACGVCFFDWAVFVWEVSWECVWWLCNQLVQFHWKLSSWCLIESVSAVHCRSPWFWSFSCAVQWLVSKKMIESSPGDIFIIRRCILDQRPCPWTLPSIDGLVMEGVRQPTYLSANGYFHLIPTSMSQSFNLSRIFNLLWPLLLLAIQPPFLCTSTEDGSGFLDTTELMTFVSSLGFTPLRSTLVSDSVRCLGIWKHIETHQL